ncbi:MAG TPA: GntR family transcriptional regulator [Pseudogracilibacillus sp.]|nr:GntR family transcriptional regulator [Pseudogracilibacillus sp.]
MNKLLNHETFEPLYHQLKNIIRGKIETGEWEPGDKISSENDLRNEYKISRNTVQKAVDELVQDGVLERKQGKGTFVSRPKIEQSLTSFYSFSKVMESQGMNPKDIILSINVEKADKTVSKRLQIEPSDEVFALKRLRYANDEPIILETSYLPKKYIQNLSLENLENHSLYGFLEVYHDITVVKAKETFEPVIVRQHESELLQIKPGSPCLLLDRLAYDTQGRTIEFCRSIVRGDRCRFYTELL